MRGSQTCQAQRRERRTFNYLLDSSGGVQYNLAAFQSSKLNSDLEVHPMSNRVLPPWKLSLTIGVMFISVVLSWNSLAFSLQTGSEGTRGLKPREYAERVQNQIAQKRERSKSSRPKAVAKYTALTKDNAPVADGVDVGITLWRLRPALKADASGVQEQTRIAVRKKGQAEEKTLMMTPIRAESETLFSDGDLLKFSVESPFEAYIYILNREQYADGTMSEPYMIFPSREDAGINDKGFPGRLLFLPSVKADDKFELKRLSDLNPTDSKNAERTAEVFTIIFSKQPIIDLAPLEKSDEPRKVDKQHFERWRNQWGGRVWTFESQGTAGASITKVEKVAGSANGVALTGDDPKPQTVYHVARKATDALLFDLSIKIRK